MKMSRITKRLTVILVATGIVVLGGGVAFAYWTASGEGVGSAQTGKSESFVIKSDTPAGDPLSPGGPAQSVAFQVYNPGSGNQNLASIVVRVANPDGSEWTDVKGCSAKDYEIGKPKIEYGEIAPSESASGVVTITMNNLPVNQDACQGVTVPLYFSAS